MRIVAIQPSVPQTLIWDPEADQRRFAELLAISAQAMTNQPDLLLWPESAVPMFEGVYRQVSQFAESNRVAIIFNGDDAEFHPAATNFFNSAFLIRPDGNCAGVYHKQKLVIFGEYIPLARWLPACALRRPADRRVRWRGSSRTAQRPPPRPARLPSSS